MEKKKLRFQNGETRLIFGHKIDPTHIQTPLELLTTKGQRYPDFTLR